MRLELSTPILDPRTRAAVPDQTFGSVIRDALLLTLEDDHNGLRKYARWQVWRKLNATTVTASVELHPEEATVVFEAVGEHFPTAYVGQIGDALHGVPPAIVEGK